jgi:hypothetical protein
MTFGAVHHTLPSGRSAFGAVHAWPLGVVHAWPSGRSAFGEPVHARSSGRSMHGLNLGLNMFSSCLEMQRVLVQPLIVLLLAVIVEQQLAPAMAMQVARLLCLHVHMYF